MQRRTRQFSILPIAIAVAIVLAGGVSCARPAHAAELGDARVASHIGQQLVADIELTMLEDAHAPVQVRLADPEVYSGAGIALPPALSTLTLSVMRRDGRQFLHATTLRPVEADHLHLYLELVDHGQRVVRLATLWLTPDPKPAPLPSPAAAPAPASAPAPMLPAPALAQVGAPVRVPAPARARGEGAAASELPPSAPEAHTARRSRPGGAPASDTAPAAGPRSAAASAAPAPIQQPASIPAHSPIALPLPLRRGAPAACAPQDGDAQSCTVLGAKNAELRHRIGQLEERVRGLQARLGVAAGAASAAAGAQVAPAPAPHDAAKPDVHTAAAQTAKPATHDGAAGAHPAEPPQSAAHASAADTKPPQTAAEAKPEPQPEAKPEPKPEPKPPAPPGPKPISSIKPLVPHKPKTPPPDDDLPLGAIGAGLALLAVAGGAAALLKARAKRARKVDMPAGASLLGKLRGRFGKGAGAQPASASRVEPVDAAVAEPSLE